MEANRYKNMQLRSISKPLKRAGLAIVCGLILLLFYTLRGRHSEESLPPLPGTYQYFIETDFHSNTRLLGAVSHCDTRFAPKTSPEVSEVRHTLLTLLKSYSATMDSLNIDTWMAHGVLLGWYWNDKLLPWDTDLDVQMSADSLAMLAKSYNMTEYQYPLSGPEPPRNYLLDVNPHYTITSNRDVANKIDARWIDTTNGKFVDITAVHESQSRKGTSRVLFCKDGHEYRQEDVYPLVPSLLEGVKVKVPSAPEKILREEYGKKALANTRFHWHRFDPVSRIWEPE